MDDPDERERADWTAQDCPDDAPDGTCWDCGAHKSRPHREDCATRELRQVAFKPVDESEDEW